MTKEEIIKVYLDELSLHRESSDERKWEAIADTLDLLSGWCAPGKSIYPHSK